MIKIFILTAALSMLTCFASFADSPKSDKFPYTISFDTEELGRLCYAGHAGKTVKYRDGIAVTPNTTFSLVPVENAGDTDLSKVSVDIALLYENDMHSASFRETVRAYQNGDLNTTEEFPLLSENTIANLGERDKLYSDHLKGFVMNVNFNGGHQKKKVFYLYMCTEEDYLELLESAPLPAAEE